MPNTPEPLGWTNTNVRIPIPKGMHLVESGCVKEGDKIWNMGYHRWEIHRWYDVDQPVDEFFAVARKNEEKDHAK